MDEQTRTTHRGNRHRRSEEARLSVLQAADGLLVEVGYAKLTIEGIAQRAGVAKQTIYRWWPSKNDILMDAFGQDAVEYLDPADTGDLGQDLRAHALRVATFVTESDAGAVFRVLIALAQHDDALGQRLRSQHLVRLREYDRLPFARALARGDLPAGTDLDLLVSQMFGPLYYRALVSGEPITPAFVDALARAVLAGLGVRE